MALPGTADADTSTSSRTLVDAGNSGALVGRTAVERRTPNRTATAAAAF